MQDYTDFLVFCSLYAVSISCLCKNLFNFHIGISLQAIDPLIGHSLINAVPSHCQHCCITLSLAKTSSYCGHYLNTVTSPPHWQKHPLIGHSLNNAVPSHCQKCPLISHYLHTAQWASLGVEMDKNPGGHFLDIL